MMSVFLGMAELINMLKDWQLWQWVVLGVLTIILIGLMVAIIILRWNNVKSIRDVAQKSIPLPQVSSSGALTYVVRSPSDVIEDFPPDTITDETLKNYQGQTTMLKGCIIPRSEGAKPVFEELYQSMQTKPNVTVIPNQGKRPANFKTNGRTFALLYDLGSGRVRLVIKCGPAYGSKLKAVINGIEDSRFPQGVLWLSADSGKDCSAELMNLLSEISYRIASNGY